MISPKWWDFQCKATAFWRLYRNEREGAFLTVAGRRVALQGGRLYLIPPRLPLAATCQYPIQHFYAHFDVAGMPEIALREMFSALMTQPCDPALEGLTGDVSDSLPPCWNADNPPLDLGTECRIKSIVYEVLARHLQALPTAQIERCWHLAERVKPVSPALDYIEGHLTSNLSNPILAQRCRVSEGHFIRTFTACMEQTPTQYVMERRIRASLHRLLLTSETIDQIAEECGFGSRHYFSRVFARQMGQSPAAYRRGDSRPAK